MRIAMVTDSYYPTRDGVVTSITTVKAALEAMGHQVFVIAPDPGEAERIEGVHYFPAVRFRGYDGYYLPILPSNKAEMIDGLGIDVIHIHGIAVMALKAVIAARYLKKPVVLTFHTMVNDTMKYYSPVKMPEKLAERLVWIYLRNLLKRPDVITVPTEAIAQELQQNGVRPRELRTVSTGIDTSRFTPHADGTRVKDMYGLHGKKVAVHVGRISFEKNIRVIVEALSTVEGCVLLVVGKGPAEEDLREFVSEMKMEDRVIFTGFVDDGPLPEYYAAADVAVSASGFETQGLSVLEAMSSGLPAVCMNARAFKDFVSPGINGYLFDGTAEDCARGLKVCLDDRVRLGAGARETAESFSTERTGEELTDVYEYAVASKRRRLGLDV